MAMTQKPPKYLCHFVGWAVDLFTFDKAHFLIGLSAKWPVNFKKDWPTRGGIFKAFIPS
jgi:hypothetical protein